MLAPISSIALDQKVEGSNPSSPANITSRETKLQSGLVLGDSLPRMAANLLVKAAAVGKPPTLCDPFFFHAVEDHLRNPALLAHCLTHKLSHLLSATVL